MRVGELSEHRLPVVPGLTVGPSPSTQPAGPARAVVSAHGRPRARRDRGPVTVVVVGRRLGLSHDDQPPVAGLQHLHGQPVQPRQRLPRDHLLHRPRHRVPGGEVDDPVQVGQQRVDVVGDEQHGHALPSADLCHERGHDRLVGQVEAVERLVQQQQLRPAHERLGDQQPLLLAAGELPDRAVRVLARADELDHLLDPLPRPPACASSGPAGRERQRQPPAVAVEPQAHHVAPAQPRAGVERAPLRQVPDPRVLPPRGPPQHAHLARRKRQRAEHRLQQRRLARAVRAEHRHELAVAHGDVHPAPDRPPPSRTAAPLSSTAGGDEEPGQRVGPGERRGRGR